MPTIVKSIGTVGRDYSTITAWEADLDNAGIYASGDTARGEGYDDSAFDETVTINGGGTVGLAAVILTAASGEQHDGTPGTGFRIVRTGMGGLTLSVACTVSLLELNCGGLATDPGINVNHASAVCRQVIVHNDIETGNAKAVLLNFTGSTILDSFIFNWKTTATGTGVCRGIDASGSLTARTILQNTVVGIVNDNGTGACSGIASRDSASHTVKNNVVCDVTGTTSGTKACFSGHGASTVTATNASSDSTAPSPIAAEPVVSAVEFVSNTAPYDLHLASGAECIDAGTDLGTTPTSVNIDIDGRDRDAQGDIWDVGADEFVAAPPTFAGRCQIIGSGILAGGVG